MMKTIKVSDKGQIAIPGQIRATLGIKRGDNLVMIQIDNRILLEKAQRMEERIKDEYKDILHYNQQSLKKVWDNKEDDIWNGYLKRKRCRSAKKR